MTLADRRREYARAVLDEAHASPDPFEQLRVWLADAAAAELADLNAMTLATATGDGVPNARIVLLKGVDDRGLRFFTDYRSAKGHELAANPRAALVLYWSPLERQIRVAGSVERLDRAASEAYFHSRPRGSQLGAWASEQSATLADRAVLDAALARVRGDFGEGEIPLPPAWGGFRVVPERMEFWQGRPDRLHDRLLYTRTSDHAWTRVRLSP